MNTSQEMIVFIVFGLLVTLCLTQWTVIKIFIYKCFHFPEPSLNPQKLSEKEKIRQNALAFFFILLAAIALSLEIASTVEIIFVMTIFFILFGFFYLFINTKLK